MLEEVAKYLTGVDILERKSIYINTSCGFVYKTPKGKEEKKAMLHEADTCLYAAKHKGRNKIVGKALCYKQHCEKPWFNGFVRM